MRWERFFWKEGDLAVMPPAREAGSLLLISAGIGSPAECELAVDKMLEFLEKRFRIEVLERSEGHSGYARSVLLASPDDLSAFEGAVQWQCPSPLRPGHKRKNWFIKATLCRMDEPEFRDFDEKLVEFSTCRASGPGGQHVNKTESAVRAVYPPLGLCVECADERSQLANKKRAVERLRAKAALMEKERRAAETQDLWRQKGQVERGGRGLVFRGVGFER